jgi:hypothetical protein
LGVSARRYPLSRRYPVDLPGEPQHETFNPWSIVNLVFRHLADQGLHPILGEAGDPGGPAAELLRSLGIQPAAEGNLEISRDIRRQLAEIRTAVFGGS